MDSINDTSAKEQISLTRVVQHQVLARVDRCCRERRLIIHHNRTAVFA